MQPDPARLQGQPFLSTVQCSNFFISCSLLFSSYVTNTCVDSPHDKKIVAIQFQPQQKRDESTPPLAMTAGKDGKFKIWLLDEETAIKGTYV